MLLGLPYFARQVKLYSVSLHVLVLPSKDIISMLHVLCNKDV